MNGNWILFFAGTNKEDLALKQLKYAGFKILLALSSNSIEKSFSRDLYDDKIYLDYKNINQCLSFVSDTPYKIFYVYALKDQAMFCVSVLNAFLQKIWTSPATILVLQNKIYYRALLQEEIGFKAPFFHVCKNKKEALYICAKLDKRLILKPSKGLGSIQVFEFPRQEDKILDQLDDAYAPFIVEEFVEGKEFSIDGFCINGVSHLGCIVEKILKEDTFLEIGHKMPYILSSLQRKEIEELVTRALRFSGVIWGTFHIEFWIKENGDIVLGELHNRPGGAFIGDMTQEIEGIDFHSSIFLSLMHDKESIQTYSSFTKGAASYALIPKYKGYLQSLDIPSSVYEDKNYKDLHIHRRIGDEISLKGDVWDTILTSWASGDDKNLAFKNAKSICSRVNVNIS